MPCCAVCAPGLLQLTFPAPPDRTVFACAWRALGLCTAAGRTGLWPRSDGPRHRAGAWSSAPARCARVPSVPVTRWRNRLRTPFSDYIAVIQQHTAVFKVYALIVTSGIGLLFAFSTILVFRYNVMLPPEKNFGSFFYFFTLGFGVKKKREKKNNWICGIHVSGPSNYFFLSGWGKVAIR